MKWITRARPKTDRIACPWLISQVHRPRRRDPLRPRRPGPRRRRSGEDAISFDAPGARYDHRDGKCTFEVLIDDYDLGTDPALMRLAKIVHAADIADDLGTDPAGPGLLAIGLGGLDVEADDHRLLDKGRFVYDALYAWCQRQVPATGMTGTIGYDELRAGTVRQVAQLMAAAAITAPKSGGQLFLAGKPSFMETVIADDPATRDASSPPGCGPAARNAASGSGSATPTPPKRSTPSCSSGSCPAGTRPTTTAAPAATPPAPSSSTHTKTLRSESAELEFAGPVCNLRDIDLGIAVGSAAKTAAIHSIDCRCQTRVAVAARKLGLIQADHAVALSLSMTHKAIGFDRPMPEADFDNLDLPPTGTLPVGVPGATRHGGATQPPGTPPAHPPHPAIKPGLRSRRLRRWMKDDVSPAAVLLADFAIRLGRPAPSR